MNKDDILKILVNSDDIEYYSRILDNLDDDINYPDQISRTISTLFKLCILGKIDPWNVDISKLSEAISHIDKRDFELHGIILARAWHILYEKSKSLIPRQPEPEPDYYDEPVYNDDYYIPEIEENIAHKETAKVTILDIIEDIKKIRKNDVQEKRQTVSEVIVKSNRDEIEEGIKKLISDMESFENPFKLEDHWGNERSERANFILYSLFLVKMNKLKFSQEVPYGDVLYFKTEK
ncbi:hypothetical protein [Picrophilus oshimae]|uniref:Condensin subunit ScpA n=1 Tax=Picrophilus torridus (strain ATCC 700027 / DSM 9790 / JCM 10055 / NBRC 100828 / KAW 2/3) TaxID=1122961 RepID=Q6L0R0_PICTO|nr:hypothetical protein [Picrophilus oshimae]AAT43442.1 hypothetical protein PTO0857 [Picrophilus oshimae DSM 9789]SMD30249.1 condensin subunit ScpA [Picrophilus oshimae DSM 9789]